MADTPEQDPKHPDEPVSTKDQIIALFLSGVTEVEDLALMTGTRPTYVGSILREADLVEDYFDLYTPTTESMNVYSRYFAGKLGFKDVETARRSVVLIDELHHQFDLAHDRAGQHHALMMALTMFNRARWTGKHDEAEVYRRWLAHQLGEQEGED